VVLLKGCLTAQQSKFSFGGHLPFPHLHPLTVFCLLPAYSPPLPLPLNTFILLDSNESELPLPHLSLLCLCPSFFFYSSIFYSADWSDLPRRVVEKRVGCPPPKNPSDAADAYAVSFRMISHTVPRTTISINLLFRRIFAS
jgi:hypothetical protein